MMSGCCGRFEGPVRSGAGWGGRPGEEWGGRPAEDPDVRENPRFARQFGFDAGQRWQSVECRVETAYPVFGAMHREAPWDLADRSPPPLASGDQRHRPRGVRPTTAARRGPWPATGRSMSPGSASSHGIRGPRVGGRRGTCTNLSHNENRRAPRNPLTCGFARQGVGRLTVMAEVCARSPFDGFRFPAFPPARVADRYSSSSAAVIVMVFPSIRTVTLDPSPVGSSYSPSLTRSNSHTCGPAELASRTSTTR